MVDIVDKNKRSWMMSRIRGKNTKPELIIRKALFAQGYRYKLHDKLLPGKPDLVFPKFQAVIFIHGCFWHGHECHLFKWPSTREKFWKNKILGNRNRDMENIEELKSKGWRILVIWECAIKGKTKLSFTELVEVVSDWLETGKGSKNIKGME